MRKLNHIDELQELYNNYKGKDLETVLGVSVRSIQNYLKEENPSTPNDKVVEKIHEAFANHKAGKALGDVEEKNEIDYSQPIIQVVLNLSYTSKKNADSMDKMAATNQKNTEIIAALVGAILPNSKLGSQLASSLADLYKDNDRPVEDFLPPGADLSKKANVKESVKG